MSAEPPDQSDASIIARLQEQALSEQLALKDRALDVAAEGITIADADRMIEQATFDQVRSEWIR